MMKAKRFRYGIGVMSRILEVSRSGYYKWFSRKPSRRVQEEGRLEVEIKGVIPGVIRSFLDDMELVSSKIGRRVLFGFTYPRLSVIET